MDDEGLSCASDDTEVLEYGSSENEGSDEGMTMASNSIDDCRYSARNSVDNNMASARNSVDDDMASARNSVDDDMASARNSVDDDMANARNSVSEDMISARNLVDEDATNASPSDDEEAICVHRRAGTDDIEADSDSDSSLEFERDDNAVGLLNEIDVDVQANLYISVGFFVAEAEAEKALHELNEFVYIYKTRYISAFRAAKEYMCRSHRGCKHSKKLIIHNAGENATRYQVLQKGQHCGRLVNNMARGISPVLKPEIDALLQLGMGAGRIRNMLQFKYLRDPAMTALIPKTKQMENRKAHIKKKAGEGWEIEKFITLKNWTAGKLCQTREEFALGDEADAAKSNAMIVLDEFEHFVDIEGVSVASLGIVFTSRALFRNVHVAVRDQEDNLVLSTDGTYRIHFGGWTLVDCGGILLELSGPGYVQRFRPWLYMFVRTESKFAYESMFRALIKYAKVFYDVDVAVRCASIDHSDSIASALELVWPRVEILTCWEHLLRQSSKMSRLEVTKGFIKDVAQPHLRQLHLARSLKQFRSLSKRVIKAWQDSNETALAEWLQTVYLTPRWERWCVNGSSVPGFLPTQQPIESHHRVIKVIVTDYKKAPTVTVLNSVLPRVLLYDASNLVSEHHRHFSEGPLPIDAVTKAKEELLLENNYRQAESRTRIRICFNSEHAMVLPIAESNLAAVSVTVERMTTFQKSLQGRLGPMAPYKDAVVDFLSLQEVTADKNLIKEMDPIGAHAKWPAEDIRAVRAALRCTCKAFMHTGWVCSHIIASLHLLGKIKIDLALERIPMRGLPGRPRALTNGLQRDSDVYDVDRLIELFTKHPGRPLKWPVVQEFEVESDGKMHKERRVGQVAGCRLSHADGVYVWSVVFLHGDSLEYQVEELAHAVRRAYALGTR